MRRTWNMKLTMRNKDSRKKWVKTNNKNHLLKYNKITNNHKKTTPTTTQMTTPSKRPSNQ